MVSYDILRNAIMMELIDNYVMIQLPEGKFQLYSLIEDSEDVLTVIAVKSWDMREELEKVKEDNDKEEKITFSNITKTGKKGNYIFSVIAHVQTDDSTRRLLISFDEKNETTLRSLAVPKSGKTAPHIIGELCNQDGQTFFCSAEKGSLDASIFKEKSASAITCCGQVRYPLPSVYNRFLKALQSKERTVIERRMRRKPVDRNYCPDHLSFET